VLVDLVPATPAHAPILANLLQLYMHDFSEFVPLAMGPDGKFDYPHLSLYWSDTTRFPFLAALNGEWAGFVFIRQLLHSAGEGLVPMGAAFDVAEFFVLRGQRRQGVGIHLAHLAFQRFGGNWQVRVMESNSAACHFWQRAVESFTGASALPRYIRIDNVPWKVFQFESRSGESRPSLSG
jgi:predicted acetyltransferase